jgi:hypothetical protein
MGWSAALLKGTLMKMLVRFAPWIVFTVVGEFNWRLGAFAALATLVAVVALSRPWHLGVLNLAMLTFFAAAAVLALVSPHSGLSDWLHPLSAAWMCVVTLISIAVDRPFTLDFSRDAVSAQVAATPAFLALNKEISLHWGEAFAAIAAAASFGVVRDRPLIGTAATVFALLWAVRYAQRAAERPSTVAVAP